jgi:hypothetical protein
MPLPDGTVAPADPANGYGLERVGDAILATGFPVYAGGHGYRCGTRADVERSRELLIDLITTTKRYMGEISYGPVNFP